MHICRDLIIALVVSSTSIMNGQTMALYTPIMWLKTTHAPSNPKPMKFAEYNLNFQVVFFVWAGFHRLWRKHIVQ